MRSRYARIWFCLLWVGCSEPSSTSTSPENPSDSVQASEQVQDTSINPEIVETLDEVIPPDEDTSLGQDVKLPEDDSMGSVEDAGITTTDAASAEDTQVEADAQAEQGDTQEEVPCLDDPGCSGPGEVKCGDEGGTVMHCTEVEFACFKWQVGEVCEGEMSCEDGKCVPSCSPVCPPGWCGDNGCGDLCDPCLGGDQVCYEGWCEVDGDGDGFPAIADCNDGNPQVNPSGTEQPYDGEDNDCDPTTSDDDIDGDGSICTCMGGEDCDDNNTDIGPQILDMVGDGLDLNCDGHDGVDADGDAYASELSGGQDCNDLVATTNPGTGDILGDGVDSNCDGVDGFAPPPLPDGRLCTISGTVGSIVTCPFGVAQYSNEGLFAVAGSGSFSYHTSKLQLLGMYAAPCSDEDCSASVIATGGLLPTGHQLTFSPDGTVETPFKGKVAWSLLQQSGSLTPLSDAVLTADQNVSGTPTILWFRFQLLEDVEEENGVPVVMLKSRAMTKQLQMKQTTVDDGLMVVYP